MCHFRWENRQREKEREGGRETHTERGREKERASDIETERETEREIETERQRERETGREIERDIPGGRAQLAEVCEYVDARMAHNAPPTVIEPPVPKDTPDTTRVVVPAVGPLEGESDWMVGGSVVVY